MPALTNPRHERFAQELASGKHTNNGAAYVASGYACDQSASEAAASRLLRKVKDIGLRVKELQTAVSERTQITLEALIDYAQEARLLAQELGQPAAMVQAIKEIGVLSGKRIEKRELGEPGEFERLDDVELLADLRADAAKLGLSAFKPNGKTH